MRFKEFQTNEVFDQFLKNFLGGTDGLSSFGSLLPNKSTGTKTADTKTADTGSTQTTTPTTPTAPTTSQSTTTVANGYTPKGATPAQMKQFGPSSKDKIDWKEMRSYIENKLSLNHAVAMVVNCKWESGWQPGRWVHSDASQGPSGGLFMFHDATFSGKGFLSSMVAACGGPGKWQTNWKGQIDFALSSTIGKGPAFANKKFNSPEEATYWFCVEFERPQNAVAKAKERAREARLYSK
jgi:hypothetical protein